jgi:Flp pilus assembly protein TadD
MVFSLLRNPFLKASWAVVLMLGCAALPAQAGWFSSDSKAQKTDSKPGSSASPTTSQSATAQPATGTQTANLPATNLDDSIRQAQLLRLAGQYPEAIKHLSQVMLVASDDARVVSEYGKTLASMGRASDAVNFLTRAQQLQPNDWTLYSAMGVAYDQLGDQKNAQDAYEHALVLKPNDPSVLSNYALSRMLAKDPDMARKLAARAESTGGMGDDKIARNIAMIRSLAPEEPAPAAMAVAAQPAQNPVAASAQASKAPAQVRAELHDNRVVMQHVPVDPQAGPVAKPAPAPVNTATQAPRALQPQIAADVSHAEASATLAPQAPKPVTFQPLPPPVAPGTAAELKPLPVKTAETAKPAAPARLMPPAPAKAAETASASVTLRLAPPLSGGTDKPGQPPKVLPPVPVKAAAKPNANVPGLRVSANAY